MIDFYASLFNNSFLKLNNHVIGIKFDKLPRTYKSLLPHLSNPNVTLFTETAEKDHQAMKSHLSFMSLIVCPYNGNLCFKNVFRTIHKHNTNHEIGSNVSVKLIELPTRGNDVSSIAFSLCIYLPTINQIKFNSGVLEVNSILNFNQAV